MIVAGDAIPNAGTSRWTTISSRRSSGRCWRSGCGSPRPQSVPQPTIQAMELTLLHFRYLTGIPDRKHPLFNKSPVKYDSSSNANFMSRLVQAQPRQCYHKQRTEDPANRDEQHHDGHQTLGTRDRPERGKLLAERGGPVE